jgi:hypothetical protein
MPDAMYGSFTALVFSIAALKLLRLTRLGFIALALLLGQHGAMLHALSHVRQALAAMHEPGKAPPPLGHAAEQCLSFHAVDTTLPCGQLVIAAARIEPPAPLPVALPHARQPRIMFDPRGPPSFA